MMLVVLMVVGMALFVVFMGVKAVPQEQEYTVERFGRSMRTLTPGLPVITPFVERIGAKLNMMQQVLDVASQEVITKETNANAASRRSRAVARDGRFSDNPWR